MKKLVGIIIMSSLILTACNEKVDESTPETKNEKSEIKSKSESKIKKNVTTEVPTTEAPTTEAPATEAPATEAPTTELPIINTTEIPTSEMITTETSQAAIHHNANPSQDEIREFCKDIYGGIPEVCMTPAIKAAGNEKVAIERRAIDEYEQGLISEQEYYKRLDEATAVMSRAWEKEFGVYPGR